MRLYSVVLIPLSLCAVTLQAPADDRPERLPSVPTLTPDRVPSFTYPTPMGTSSGSGILSDDQTPAPVIEPQPQTPGGIIWQRSTRSHSSTIDQFQSSSYWAAPHVFNPAAAPDYGSGPAEGWGVHVRYPYFKHRAPWTYQGPAAISHTIHW